MRSSLVFLCAVPLALLVACGGASNKQSTGTLTLDLAADSFPAYSFRNAVVSITQVNGSQDGSNWVKVADVKATLDLAELQTGGTFNLCTAASVSSGTFHYFRLLWSSTNYASPITAPAWVELPDQSQYQLAMPSGGSTTFSASVDVPANGSATGVIVLSGDQLIQNHAGSGSDAFVFQATGEAFDAGQCASISGTLAAGSTALTDVEVYAETVDGQGTASIQRRVLSDSSGNFVLNALPTGSLYFVVAQPAGTTSSFTALASAGVNASSATAYTGRNLAYGAAQSPGGLTLTVTPASSSSQGTWGELRQTLATPAGSQASQILIVRSLTASTGSSSDTVSFGGLAPGNYGVTAQRSTSGAGAVAKAGSTVQVSAGSTATTTIGY